MTMTEISKQATALGMTPEMHELLLAAFAAGITTGVQDAAMTLADNGEQSGAEMIAANWHFEIA